MPSIGLHLAITLFILASFLRDDEFKPALLLLPFGLISDLDSYLGVHRATLHNLFVIVVPLLVLLANKRLHITALPDRYFIFASILLASHITLDGFYNGVFLLHPFSTASYNPLFWLGVNEQGLTLLFSCLVPGTVGELVYVTTPTPSVPEIPIISSGIELIILLIALFSFGLKYKADISKFFIRGSRDKKIAR
ncbi:MAG TPA: hypothetical protein ENN68_00965 [Methanomicrobia archaeon]|nr:hypothetical protein [Methanomicrobia archaeon]